MLFFQHQPEIKGLDTETYKGEIKLICNSDGECYEPIDDSDALIEWIYRHSSDDLNFFYNIKFDLSVILKRYITDGNSKDILSGKNIKIGSYIVSYISGKAFTIKPAGTRNKKYPIHRFYDIANFYKDGTATRTLDSVAKEELNEGKNNEELDIDRERIGEESGYYEAHRSKIIEYCIKDSELTKRLAELRIDTAKQMLGQIPTAWYSNASLSKSYLKLRHPEEAYAFPKLILKLPTNQQYKAFELIRNSYYGGLFYDKAFGNLGKLSEVDANSMYPDAIRKLKSIVDAQIFHTTKYEPDADYSFYKIKLRYPKDFPFPYRQKTKGAYMIIYPFSIDYIETWTTGVEIEYLREKGADFQIIEGYAIRCKNKEPAFKDVEELYELRKQYKKEGKNSLQYLIKITTNAIYGTTAQQNGGFKEFTNFVYSSYITAMSRIKILRKCDQIGWDKVRYIRTDSIAYSGEYRESSDQLGEFKLEWQDEEIISYMSGLNLRNKRVDAKRGFGALDADSLLNTTGNEFTLPDKKRPTALKEAIIQHKPDKIGQFENRERTLHLQSNEVKYVIDGKKLNFETLNKTAVETKPLCVFDNASPKKEMKEEYLRLIKLARTVKTAKPKTADKLEMKPDRIKENVYTKLKHLTYPRTFRDRERIKRIMTSKKVQNVLGIYTVVSN